MKLYLTYKSDNQEYTEIYDANDLTDPEYFFYRNKPKISISTQKEAEKWAEAVINFFNSTLRFREFPRILINVELKEDPPNE